MLSLPLLLSAVSLVAAHDLIGMSSAPAPRKDIILPGVGSSPLSLAVTCATGKKACNDSCIPILATCCNNGLGSYCDLSYTCKAGGCCPIGKTCTGNISGCGIGKVSCGSTCIPSGSQCCSASAGTWCASGNTCTSDGKCQAGSRLCARKGKSKSKSKSKLGTGKKGSSGTGEENDCSGNAGSMTTPSVLLAGVGVGLVALFL